MEKMDVDFFFVLVSKQRRQEVEKKSEILDEGVEIL